MKRSRWAVMISGRGSNLRALLQTWKRRDIALVLSSKADAPGIHFARRAGVPVEILPKKIDWREVHRLLNVYRIDRVFLAGFMKILPADFVGQWEERIVNVHPSLLPAYAGLDSIRRAYDDRHPVGVTVHEVTAGVDAGPVLVRRAVDDSANKSWDEVLWQVHVTEQRLVARTISRWRCA